MCQLLKYSVLTSFDDQVNCMYMREKKWNRTLFVLVVLYLGNDN